jgi:hypothetical protein
MGPSIRQAAGMIAVLGCFGLIVAAQSGVGHGIPGFRLVAERAQMNDEIDDESTGSVGPATRRAAPELSDEDRFHIYDGVMRIPDAPLAQATPPDERELLPDEVAMQDLPLSVIRRLPQVAGLKFAKFDDRIVVVNPTSRVVVAMIPRYKLMP